MKKIVIATTLLLLLTIVPSVSASDGATERTECTTGAYGQQTCTTTKIECTTGAYGQQNCQTVDEVKKVLGAKTTHEVVDSGIEDLVPLASLAMLGLSSFGLAFVKKNK